MTTFSILAFLMALFAAPSAPVSIPTPDFPLASATQIVSSSSTDGLAYLLHADGAVTVVHVESLFSPDAATQVSFYQQTSGDTTDTATLTTSWRGQDGLTHEVTTPIAGTTPRALSRAVKTHAKVVAAMLVAFPKADPPPP